MTTCCSLTMSLWPKPKSPTFTRKLQLINPPSSFTHHLSFPIPSLPHRKSCFIRLSSSSSVTSMDSISGLSNEVAQDFSPYLKIYKDGRVERLSGTDIVPTSFDPQSGVESKDAVISPGVSARLYIPKSKIATNPAKLPLLVYYHGGGFCMGSPFCAYYNSYVTSLVAEANVVAVSVDYRKAPENPLPIGYDDSWDALKWIQSHVDGKGPEDWLNSHADFERVFFAGDSAGANIAHHMALRVGFDGLLGVKLKGIALVHPYFWGSEPIDGETEVAENRGRAEAIWRFACPSTVGADDPLINPGKDPKLGNIEAEKVLVCVAELDVLRQRGFCYSELLKESGCGGDVEVVESKGEDHVFHLNNPVGENSVALLKKIASFFNA